MLKICRQKFNCYFNHAVITTAEKHKNRFAIQMSEERKIYVVVINSLSKWVPFPAVVAKPTDFFTTGH